ncbi:MAG: HD domain-containing protein [Deltaproteobacteria bacterium]|nr:HD domain-containing protein [Deltaproteobacteria bacterium]
MEPWQQCIVGAGGRIYEVGGAVRDALLGRPVKDRDYLITAVPMPQITALLQPYGKVSLVGKSFGVIKFSPHQRPDLLLDLAIPRREVSTGVHHRDFNVAYDHTLPAEIDLARRDFTINAMARALDSGELLDPFGGRADLDARVLRQVFPDAFPEDPLRMLRAVQFAARFGLTIEPATLASLRQHAALIRTVSAERIIEEIGKLFRAERPSQGFYLMAELGLLPHVFPELEACRGVEQEKRQGDDVFHHTMRVLDAARSDSEIDHRGDLTLLFAALYHDVGKPQTKRFDPAEGRMTFFGHQLVSRRIAKKQLGALHVQMLGVDLKQVCRLVEHHMFETKASFTEKAIRRFINKVGPDLIALLLDLRLADNRGGKYPAGIKGVLRLKARIQAELAKKPPFGPKDLAITGHDLMTAGIPAGPQMGAILKQLVDLCLDDPALNEKDRLLELAKGMGSAV